MVIKEKWVKDGKSIGKGGNGVVWRVKDEKGNFFAKKELIIKKNCNANKMYNRFRDEVETIRKYGEEDGIINLIDCHLPKKPTLTDIPYYVMPLAITFSKHIENQKLDFVYENFLKICSALKFLHEKGITHRDIKPDNILVVDSSPVLSDFGLVDFPEKKDISSHNEKIGPRWTIAPEMERISSQADFKKADIYSLAKTLWILFANKEWGFEGQYVKHSTISLDKHIKLSGKYSLFNEWNCNSIVLLENLLIDATNNDPGERPDIDEFITRLTEWFDANDNFEARNMVEWEDAIHHIFPLSIPQSAQWSKFDDIFTVLTILTKYHFLNHSFLPDNGGVNVDSVIKSQENNCLTLNEDCIVSPKILYFEFISENLSYFLLELNDLESKSANKIYDIVGLDKKGNYIEYHEGNLMYKRYKTGRFVIVPTTSAINRKKMPHNSYDALHMQMSNKEYRSFVALNFQE